MIGNLKADDQQAVFEEKINGVLAMHLLIMHIWLVNLLKL